jgi:EAL and modified HD-GYP domain-containing signal transduction protein
VYAYELLFRFGAEMAFHGDGDEATRTMLDNAVMFGLENLTDGLPAFLNCTLEALTEHLVEVLPPQRTVLEVLETLEMTPELIDSCRKLKELGFKLAMDDFRWKEGVEPLVEIADYVKVDILLSDRAERTELFRRLKPYPATMLAEKVETPDENEQLRAEGFELFQGYYFCRPKLQKKREVAANRITQIELLRSLQKSPIDLHHVSSLVQRDPAIAYRLLRLVNSPGSGIRQEIRSVESALIVVGEETFRRMALLAIAKALNGGKSVEILRMALVRARFCELAARLTWRDTTEQYLLGLFSMLPAMLEVPMEEAISGLPLRAEIQEALLGVRNSDRCLLCWMESSESGNWSHCDMVANKKGLEQMQLMQCAADAMQWADEALRLVE